MKRFRFNLEKVLELRQYREEEAKIELGKAIGVLTEIENKIKQNAAAQLNAGRERFSGIAVTGGGSGAVSMFAWDGYIQRLEQEAERLMEEAARAQLVVEEKRNLYIEASRQLKVMEKLKEKREGEYRKEMFAVQTRELDDLWRAKRL
ncbi:MAG: flagellar export protein FliJ [Treponema sp.]|nr:flagellar export protein FliJ [Treponema sp.]